MSIFDNGYKELKKADEPLYKTPKSVQETIEIAKVSESGIFEAGRNLYGVGSRKGEMTIIEDIIHLGYFLFHG